ncbi:hypothetical protein MBLNU230_g0834t1 [Neophaeotheca triangularis]
MATKDFHHPYQPYQIQQQFMQAVYDCIENRKVGIFESPTGTGKSLSLICGSLTWLREHKRQTFEATLAQIQLDDDEPEWMVEHAKAAKRRNALQLIEDFEKRLEAAREREKKARERNRNGEPPSKRRRRDSQDAPNLGGDDVEQYLLESYDDAERDPGTTRGGDFAEGFTTETQQMMEKLGMIVKNADNPDQEDVDESKVFICSRTHSQLSQFVGELQRVRLPSGVPRNDPKSEEDDPVEALKQLSLGSRKNLCINKKVASLKDPTAINEGCMELQQPKTAKEHKCTFVPNQGNQDAVIGFRDHALASVRDIEDLAELGRDLSICPYYATRPAIGPAEMVTLPYPLLLQKSAREALGINLRGHVVVIDEAHNLMDAIAGIYSVHISESQLKYAKSGLMLYLHKFRNRLKGQNRQYLAQLVKIVDSLASSVSGEDAVVQIDTLLSGNHIDSINLTKLVRYISESKLARKVEGYAAHVAAEDQSQPEGRLRMPKKTDPETPALTHVQSFLMAMMNPSREGRFFRSRDGNEHHLRYMLLDPSEHFRDIVEDARAVILAGGTMSPMEDYTQQLFPYLPKIQTLSCGHIVPPENLFVRIIGSDSTSSSTASDSLRFDYKARENPKTLDRLGAALIKMASSVSGGMIVFFPSYAFLGAALNKWTTLLPQLEAMKPTFHDSRGAKTEEIFRAYSATIQKNPTKGAVLLSVLGGKLSEGINFADDLGRCVIVVGLPYPNTYSPEWKAKLQYIDDKAAARGEPRGKAGREHVENVCMRAVNQGIGRVVRHKSDWASILLFDARYADERVRGKLPGWIRESMVDDRGAGTVEDVAKDLGKFFARSHEGGRRKEPVP